MNTLDTFAEQVRDNNVLVIAREFTERGDLWQMFCDTMTPDQCLFPGEDGGHVWSPNESAAEPLPYRDGQTPVGTTQGPGYTRRIRVGTWARELEITYAAIDASQAKAIDRSAEFVAAYTRWMRAGKNKLFAAILQKGTLSAGFGDIARQGVAFNQSFPNQEDPNPGKIYDGKPLFAASGNAHPFKYHTATGSEGVNLTASLALTTANFDTARILMSQTNAIDESGEGIQIPVTHLIVPPSMKSTAVQVIKSQNLPGSANNDINPHANAVEVIEFDRLTDSASASAWWLASIDPTQPKPFMAIDSGAPRVTVSRDDRRGVMYIKCKHEFWIAPQEWRYIQANNKATS